MLSSICLPVFEIETVGFTDQFVEIKKGLQDKYDLLRSENENLLSRVAKMEEEQSRLLGIEKDKEELTNKLISLESQFQSLTLQHESLQHNSDSIQQNISAVESERVRVLEKENEDLLSSLSLLKSENCDLLTRIDSVQLDYESLEVKHSTVVSENETLKTKLSAAHCDAESLRSDLSERLRTDEHNTSEQSSADLTSTERYVIDKLKKIVSVDIPEEYCKDIAERDEASENELEDQLDMVAALVKMTVDLRWKKDTLERNLMEYTRQLRDLSAQLNGRDKQVRLSTALCSFKVSIISYL